MLNLEQIKEIIPHRDPFLLIDRVEEIVPGEKVVAYKDITENEFYFKGHFPGNPVVPGVIITESLAQAGAVCVLSLEQYKGQTAYFAGIDKMRFKKKIVPNTTLKFEVEIIKKIKNIGIGKAICFDDKGDLVAKGEITFAIEIN